MREFIAFDMDDSSIVHELLRHDVFSDRCVRCAGHGEMHLTLNFLGEVEPSLNQKIALEMDQVASLMERFSVEFRGVGAFPSAHRPSVIWVGVADGGETSRLNALLSERLSKIGMEVERRVFHPHVTLARVKCRIEQGKLDRLFDEWGDFSFGRQEVHEVILKKSELTPRGAIHTPLHVSRLRT